MGSPGTCPRIHARSSQSRCGSKTRSVHGRPIGISNPLRVSRCRRPVTGKSTVQQIASIARRGRPGPASPRWPAIGEHVQLPPVGRLGRGRDLLEPIDRGRGHDHDGAGRPRRRGGRELAVGVSEVLVGPGRHHHRERERAPRARWWRCRAHPPLGGTAGAASSDRTPGGSPPASTRRRPRPRSSPTRREEARREPPARSHRRSRTAAARSWRKPMRWGPRWTAPGGLSRARATRPAPMSRESPRAVSRTAADERRRGLCPRGRAVRPGPRRRSAPDGMTRGDRRPAAAISASPTMASWSSSAMPSRATVVSADPQTARDRRPSAR